MVVARGEMPSQPFKIVRHRIVQAQWHEKLGTEQSGSAAEAFCRDPNHSQDSRVNSEGLAHQIRIAAASLPEVITDDHDINAATCAILFRPSYVTPESPEEQPEAWSDRSVSPP